LLPAPGLNAHNSIDRHHQSARSWHTVESLPDKRGNRRIGSGFRRGWLSGASGTVSQDGLSVTFTGIATLSTVVALQLDHLAVAGRLDATEL